MWETRELIIPWRKSASGSQNVVPLELVWTNKGFREGDNISFLKSKREDCVLLLSQYLLEDSVVLLSIQNFGSKP